MEARKTAITFKRALWPAVAGTGLMGTVVTTYDDLVRAFGQPEACGDKSTVEWIIQFDEGVAATVYDWKTDVTPKSAYAWHIGGKNKRALELVELCLADGARTINRTPYSFFMM